jgi:replicative DNA helicase
VNAHLPQQDPARDAEREWTAASATMEADLVFNAIFQRQIIPMIIPTGLKPEHFSVPDYGIIWGRILEFSATGRDISAMTLLQAAPIRRQIIDEKSSGWGTILNHNAVEYAKLIMANFALRSIIDAADTARLSVVGRDIVALVSEVIETVDAVRDVGIQHHGSVKADVATVARMVADAAEQMASGAIERPSSSGIAALDYRLPMRGLAPGSLHILAGRTGMGKAQPLDAMILRQDGFAPMGEIKIGDALASWDGQPSFCSGIFPQGMKQVFRITLSDGRATECCDDHLWEVSTAYWKEARIITTNEARRLIARTKYRNRLKIRMVSGDHGTFERLPVNPWLLGFLLGNGHFADTGIYVSSTNPDLVAQIRKSLPDQSELVHVAKGDYRINGSEPGAVSPEIKHLGLAGARAETKFIPAVYKRVRRSDRAAVLRGLLDADGWVEKSGTLMFASASRALADDVTCLARSLGYWAKQTVKAAYLVHKDGTRTRKQDSHKVCISGPGIEELVTVKHKRDRLLNRKWFKSLTIKSIDEVGVKECQCISVAHPDRLYVTDDYIVTHNTLLASAIASHVARMGHGAAYFSLEVTSSEIAARIMSSIMGEGAPDYGSILAGDFPRGWQDHLRDAAGRLQGWPLHIDDSAGMTMADISVQAERLANRMAKQGHRLRLVTIDHAQIVKPSQRYAGNRVGELGEVANAGKVLAKRLQCTVMLCSQLNRSVESREDKRPSMADLRASGEVEESADAVMLLYREAYYLSRTPEYRNSDPVAVDAYEAVANSLEINVDKSRQGKPGIAHVWCDPARSIVCDRPDDRR